MSEELVERLRGSFVYDQQHYAPDPLVAEAADTIEALTAQRAALMAEVEAMQDTAAFASDRSVEAMMLAHNWMVAHDCLKAGKPYSLPTPADLPNAITELHARIAQLEAELAGAREELRLISEQLDAANAALLAQERTDD
jgi:uncharacterized coiled-coil protein SlyX